MAALCSGVRGKIYRDWHHIIIIIIIIIVAIWVHRREHLGKPHSKTSNSLYWLYLACPSCRILPVDRPTLSQSRSVVISRRGCSRSSHRANARPALSAANELSMNRNDVCYPRRTFVRLSISRSVCVLTSPTYIRYGNTASVEKRRPTLIVSYVCHKIFYYVRRRSEIYRVGQKTAPPLYSSVYSVAVFVYIYK